MKKLIWLVTLALFGNVICFAQEASDNFNLTPEFLIESDTQANEIMEYTLDFKYGFDQVTELMTREEVVELLGEPKEKLVAKLPEPPFYGPQEGLENIIIPGSEYEEWQYELDDTIYLIWFGSNEEKPKDEWKVIGKTEFPKGAVF